MNEASALLHRASAANGHSAMSFIVIGGDPVNTEALSHQIN